MPRGAAFRRKSIPAVSLSYIGSVNAIFVLLFLLSGALLLVLQPDGFLPALLAGGQKAATLSLSLLAAYSVWLGFFKVLEKSGAAEALAKRVYPLARRLFRSQNTEAVRLATENLTANLLGLPGAPTPLGVRAARKFCEAREDYAADMLLVLNATGLQIVPTTVVALRLSFSSASAFDIFLPTLLSTLFATLLGVLLLAVLRRRKA